MGFSQPVNRLSLFALLVSGESLAFGALSLLQPLSRECRVQSLGSLETSAPPGAGLRSPPEQTQLHRVPELGGVVQHRPQPEGEPAPSSMANYVLRCPSSRGEVGGGRGNRAAWDAGGLQLFPGCVRADQSSLPCLQPQTSTCFIII